ncbi:unnamed protein product, partial [marine sediment metagenome]
PPHTLDDYKFTSVWTVIFGLKTDWEQQLNCYKPFYEYAGFPVKELRVHILGRDWSRTKALQNHNYPKCEITTMPVPMWDNDKIKDFVYERVLLHQACEKLSDNDLPLCTPDERWEKPTKYAIIKEGRKSAVRVLDTLENANQYINEKNLDDKHSIVLREGESTRCEFYCHLRDYCSQYKMMKEKEDGTSA